jgi:hemolysin III
MSGERLVTYSPAEELVNRLSHGAGFMLSLAGLFLLVHAAADGGEPRRLLSCTLYGTTLMLFYAVSTVYHTVRQPRLRHLFRILDHCGIFLVIAGTYTPFTLVTLPAPWGWSIFLLIWGLAFAGAAMKVVMTGRLRIAGPLLYLAMGWLIVVAWRPLTASLPPAGVAWLLAGGAAYSFGLIFYAWTRLPYSHAVWHLFVLAGSLCHFLAVLWYVVPTPD